MTSHTELTTQAAKLRHARRLPLQPLHLQELQLLSEVRPLARQAAPATARPVCV